METKNITIITNKFRAEKESLEQLCSFLKMDMPELKETDFVGQFREICAAKIFKAIGVRNMYNSKNKFFAFLTLSMGQAISDLLSMGLDIAPDSLRLFRYNKINFVNEMKQIFLTEELDEAMLDVFNLADDNHDMIEEIRFEY